MIKQEPVIPSRYLNTHTVSEDIPVIKAFAAGDSASTPYSDIIKGKLIYPTKYNNDLQTLMTPSVHNSVYPEKDTVVRFLNDNSATTDQFRPSTSSNIQSSPLTGEYSRNNLPTRDPAVKSARLGFNFDAYGAKYPDARAVPPPDNLGRSSFATEADIQAGEASINTYDRSAGKLNSVAKSSGAGESLMGAGGDTGLAMAMGMKSYYANKSYVASDTGTTGGKIAAENYSRIGEGVSTGIIGGASAGAALGSFGGPIGSAVGGFIGAGIGGLVGGLTTHTRSLSSTNGGSIDPSNSPY